jgi:hypothetical protein
MRYNVMLFSYRITLLDSYESNMCVGNIPIEFKSYIIPMKILWIKGGHSMKTFKYVHDIRFWPSQKDANTSTDNTFQFMLENINVFQRIFLLSFSTPRHLFQRKAFQRLFLCIFSIATHNILHTTWEITHSLKCVTEVITAHKYTTSKI